MMLVLALIACDPPIPEDTGPIDTSDTDTADTDTSDTDTSDTGAGPDVVGTTALPDGTTVGLFLLDTSYFAVLSETPVATATVAAGGFSFDYEPPASEIVDAPWAAGLGTAGYAAVAYDGAPDAAGLRGVSRLDAVYFDDVVPEPYASLGLHQGWNALRADDEGPPLVGDPLALTIDDNLVAAASAVAAGTWTAPVGGLVAGFSDQDPTVGLGATAAADPWSLSLSGEPPLSTRFSTGDVTVAGFRVGAFADADASGDYSSGDTVTAVAVTGAGDPVWLAWGAPVATAHAAHVLVTRGGFRVGWSAVRGTEGATPLVEDDAPTMVTGTP